MYIENAKIEKFKNRLSCLIIKCINAEKNEEALALISTMSYMRYNYNQDYCDDKLEYSICAISKKILGESVSFQTDRNTVLFYDGFGLNSRGLAQIYIKALCNNFKVVYVTKSSKKNSIPDILKILEKHLGTVEYLDDGQYVKKIEQLNRVVEKYKPAYMFMYTTPDDVVVTTVFEHYSGVCKRFQVNLTDHAFWLGKGVFDICLEFRDYGASVSNHYRKIPKDRLLKLPYYPIVNFDTKFGGYPFPFDQKNQKLIFSGGALYKTLGADNQYYKIINYILSNYPNVVFWYAGTGNRSEMDKLIAKYSDRLYLTNERNDLYQVIKKSTFYLSTFPVCGGLMFQYAAIAGKVPVTLKLDNISDEFLLGQDSLEIEFKNFDELTIEIDRLLSDQEYLLSKENRVEKAVISEMDFEEQLLNAIYNSKTCFPIKIDEVDTSSTQKEYLTRFNAKNLDSFVAKRSNICLIKYYPTEFFFVAFKKLLKKIICNWKIIYSLRVDL